MNTREKNYNSSESFENKNIAYFEELIPPEHLKCLKPTNRYITSFIKSKRIEIENILNGNDSRFLMIIGPCSIHNIEQAKEYAIRLKELSKKVNDKILIVMRVYFEKPRTTTGWKGLINDPDLNESFDVNKGLFQARKLLIHLANIGLPSGCEILDPITPQYISDLISWGAIGARTTESQTHRQIASGLSFPIGFKNGTGGSIDIAADAMVSCNYSHCFMGITNDGKSTICKTRGNPNTHIILRGGKLGPNYYKESVAFTKTILLKKNVNIKMMIDCSHGNSGKNYKNQFDVLRNIIEQKIKYGSNIFGVMIESNINEGKQLLPENVSKLSTDKIIDELTYGVSITDCCVSFEETEEMVNYVYDSL